MQCFSDARTCFFLQSLAPWLLLPQCLPKPIQTFSEKRALLRLWQPALFMPRSPGVGGEGVLGKRGGRAGSPHHLFQLSVPGPLAALALLGTWPVLLMTQQLIQYLVIHGGPQGPPAPGLLHAAFLRLVSLGAKLLSDLGIIPTSVGAAGGRGGEA